MWLILFFSSENQCLMLTVGLDYAAPQEGRYKVPLFHMHYSVKSASRVTKPMCHPFQTDMSHMCHACEM
jgi:hypothetical protein